MKYFWIAASLALLAMTNGAIAAEQKKIEIVIDEDGDIEAEEVEEETAKDDAPPANPARFAPDFCDFEITFPEAPASAQKCVPGSKCFDVHSYTMVYDLQTSVDVSVTCNPSTPAAYKQYTQSVMKAALSGMVENKNLSGHDIGFEEKDGVKSAAITGVGTTGHREKIYSAQLWIGPNSVFTVQAELIGPQHPNGDKAFRDILQSIKTKQGKQVPRPKKAVIPKLDNQ